MILMITPSLWSETAKNIESLYLTPSTSALTTLHMVLP
jgi:hypothetical protein